MKQPKLNEIDLEGTLAGILRGSGGGLVVTLSPGQWDTLLQAAYDKGATLLEIDKNELPVKAYRKGNPYNPTECRENVGDCNEQL